MVYNGNSKATWKTFQTLEQELITVHGGKYTYDNSVFINVRTPMSITCPKHGEFMQRPRDHKRGKGCRKCFEEKNAVNRTKDIKTLTAELLKITKFTYPTLSDSQTVKSHDRLLVKCAVCGQEYTHKVCNILTGHAGCNSCRYSSSTWTEERYEGKETILYFVRINSLYKIGLTRKSIASRFYKELQSGYDIEVIFTITYSNGAEAFREEQRILKEYSKYKYRGDNVLINGGNSELFTTNIFQHGGVPSKQ